MVDDVISASTAGTESRWRSRVGHVGTALLVSGAAIIAVCIAVSIEGMATHPVRRGLAADPMEGATRSAGIVTTAWIAIPSNDTTQALNRMPTESATPAMARLVSERLRQPSLSYGLGFVSDDLGSMTIDTGFAEIDSTPTTAPPPIPPPPVHIAIPAVGIDTDVVEVAPALATVDGQTLFQWQAADWVAGHHDSSANPGAGGNIVLAGHDDVRGEVFRGLHDIAVGDEVVLTSSIGEFVYVVQEIHFRKDVGASIEDRLATGTFMSPMPEERLTLVTCWPYRVDSHRLIVVAKPKES